MLELLEPLHPKLVHFPIALFLSAFLFQTISYVWKKELLHQCSLLLYVLATLLTPLVVRTGILQAEKIHLSHPILDTHRQFALIVMWVSLVSLPVLWVVYQKQSKWLKAVFLCFLLVISICLTIAGHNGGTMVYEFGVGTDLF